MRRSRKARAAEVLTIVVQGEAALVELRRALSAARDRERALSDLLTCGVDQHLAAVARLQDGLKDRQRQLKLAQAELAPLLGRALVEGPPAGVHHLHRDDADAAFLQAIAEAALQARPGARLALTGGTGEGLFLVAGEETWVATAGPTFAAALGGRGGGRAGRYQGKAPSLAGRAAQVAAAVATLG